MTNNDSGIEYKNVEEMKDQDPLLFKSEENSSKLSPRPPFQPISLESSFQSFSKKNKEEKFIPSDETYRRRISVQLLSPREGFYIPPPGYVDSFKRKEFEGVLEREGGKSRLGRHTTAQYGDSPNHHDYEHTIHRSEEERKENKHYYPNFDQCWTPEDKDITKGLDEHKQQNQIMPRLSYHDWSVPQAKQILSHWATLATLLGGVQATLLAYYSKQQDIVVGEDLKVYRMVIAISCSGLFLEVYGALLAAGTIVASISLQARSNCNNNSKVSSNSTSKRSSRSSSNSTLLFGRNAGQNRQLFSPQETRFKRQEFDNENEETYHSNDFVAVGGFGDQGGGGTREGNITPLATDIFGGMNGISSHPNDFDLSSSSSNLSPRASAILDRLTVLVGCIIPLGAGFELIGLAGYSAWYLGTSVAITMVLTLVIAVVATLIVGFFGFQAGSKATKAAKKSSTS